MVQEHKQLASWTTSCQSVSRWKSDEAKLTSVLAWTAQFTDIPDQAVSQMVDEVIADI